MTWKKILETPVLIRSVLIISYVKAGPLFLTVKWGFSKQLYKNVIIFHFTTHYSVFVSIIVFPSSPKNSLTDPHHWMWTPFPHLAALRKSSGHVGSYLIFSPTVNCIRWLILIQIKWQPTKAVLCIFNRRSYWVKLFHICTKFLDRSQAALVKWFYNCF